MALLRSLKRTNPDIPIIVFDGGLSRTQIKKASRFAKVLPKRPFSDIKIRGKFDYITSTTLLKFEVAGLPFDSVLYLDADTVVLGDLSGAFLIPEGHVGGVPEVNTVRNMFRLQHRDMLEKTIDINWAGRGINMGFFVIRPDEWKDLRERANKLIERFGREIFSKTADQQLLSIIFNGKIHILPQKYNFSPFYDNMDDCDPLVIHYLGRCKPWHFEYPSGCNYREFRENLSVWDRPMIIVTDLLRRIFGKTG